MTAPWNQCDDFHQFLYNFPAIFQKQPKDASAVKLQHFSLFFFSVCKVIYTTGYWLWFFVYGHIEQIIEGQHPWRSLIYGYGPHAVMIYIQHYQRWITRHIVYCSGFYSQTIFASVFSFFRLIIMYANLLTFEIKEQIKEYIN